MSFTQCAYIAFPQINPPINVSANTCQLLHNACALHTGYRYQRFYTDETNLTEWYADYDFFTAYKPEFLHIARADLMPLLTTVLLQSSSDNVTYTTRVTISSPFTYEGARSDDIFYASDALDSYRYWRVKLIFSAGSRVSLSKILLGKVFDFTQNYSSFLEQTSQSNDVGLFRASSNIFNQTRDEPPENEYKIRFVGLTDAVIGSFLDNVLVRPKRFCVLYNLSESANFNTNLITHGILSRVTINKRLYNHNTLDFIFKEMLG